MIKNEKKFYSTSSVLFFVLTLTVLGSSVAYAALTINGTSVTSDAALTLTGAAASDITVGSTTAAGNIAIGGALTTGTLTLGKTTQTGITVISGSTSGANTLFDNVAGGTIAIGAANTGGINIGNGATAKTINIGTGAAVNTVVIGSTNTTSATSIQAGSGGIAITGVLTATSPVFVTPALGSATATSINKLTITAPATSATLTIVNGGSLITAGAFATTLTSTAATNVTLPTTGTLATLAGAESLSNKTLVTPALGAATATSVAIGASGTAITEVRVYSQALTPVATAAAIQTIEQTFTVTGLTTADKVFVNGPAPTSLCPAVTFRVSAANTLAIGFSTLTAVACTPIAGTYNIVAVRN